MATDSRKSSEDQTGLCVIIGGGGHAKVLIESLQAAQYAGGCVIIDKDKLLWGRQVLGVPVLGDDSLLPKLLKQGARFFVVGVGGTGDNEPRRRLFDSAVACGLEPVTIIHPSSIHSPWAKVGMGCQLLPGSIVNAGADVGTNVIINSGSIIEHDCLIADHVHVASGAVLASTVRVGAGAHIGCGAAVRQGISIGEGCIVGAGAVVVKDVPSGSMVIGVPAKQVKHNGCVPCSGSGKSRL